jgi:hypothetical protein
MGQSSQGASRRATRLPVMRTQRRMAAAAVPPIASPSIETIVAPAF